MVRFLFTLIAVAALVGCSKDQHYQLPSSVDELLAEEHTVELLSLSPERIFEVDHKGEELFHEFELLGRAELDKASADKLMSALQASTAAITKDYEFPECFNPRHGLRLKSQDKLIDLVICFECAQIYVYQTKEDDDFAGTSGAPLELFDEMVKEYNLPLPTSASH